MGIVDLWRLTGERRIALVWIVSTAARATIVPVSITAAVSLNDRGAALALVTLAGVGFLNTLGSFIAAAADAARADGPAALNLLGRSYLGVIAAATAAVTAASTDDGLMVLSILMLALWMQNWSTYRRQAQLLEGRLARPYMSLVARNVVLAAAFLTIGITWSGEQAVAVAASFALSGLLELSILAYGERGRLDVEAVAFRHVSWTLVLGYTLSCLLPWLLRVVTAFASGVDSLRLLEYADRFAYLSVSSLLGGLAIELQRRWSRSGAALVVIRREAIRFCAILALVGIIAGAVAMVFAPLLFAEVGPGDLITVWILGFVAGGLGAITIAQRFAVVVGDQRLLGRTTLLYQGCGAAGIVALAPLGLGFSATAMALAAWGLAVTLLRQRPR